MNMYCPNCQTLFEDREKCPDCLFSKLRAPKENDPVLLAKTDYMRAEMLEPMLTDAGIPHSRVGGVGGAFGMSVGMRLDVIRFFVPYGALEAAKEQLATLDGEFTAQESAEDTAKED